MPRPRRTQISLEDTPYYHCCSRVVRRAFLCGDDSYSGKNYDHRRGWVESLMFELEAVFAIDIAAFAVMSNHLHLVLRVDIETANRWTDREVLEQWHKLFKGDELTQKFAKGELVESHQVNRLKHSIALYRSRLCDISWFMRCLNEPIARQANQEDNCTGRFWEGRFKSQALLDEKAVLTAMAYVDLNPVRAQMATTPESSDYTSIQQRLGKAVHCAFHGELLPFAGDSRQDNALQHIRYHFVDYIDLVDWTGRQIRPDKRGAIDVATPPILARLGIPTDCWLQNCQQLETEFHQVIGPMSSLKQFCQKIGQHWLHGQTACRRSFG